MMLLLTVAMCFLSSGLAQNNGTYVVTAPKVARIGSPYTVTVVLSEQRNAIQTGAIVITHQSDKGQTKTASFSVNPTDYRTDVQMTITNGELALGKYWLQLSLGGKVMPGAKEIELKGNSGTILVQTDKGIYKRSQTVKMRAFIMGADLMAVKKPLDITIIDPAGNKVERFTNQSSTSGVVTKEYTLSDDPKHGEWKITIQQTDGMGSSAERKFKVDAYVLPRFSVEVKPSVSYVFVKDFSSVNFEVEAKYTYGEGVHGSVLLKYRLNGVMKEKTQRLVNGRSTFTITTADIGGPSALREQLCGRRYCWYSYQRVFEMNALAMVTEDETAEEHSKETTLKFYTEPVDMDVITSEVFRPNMKYTFYVHITDPSGAPLPMAERTKYFVNVVVTYSDQELLRVTKRPLDTSVPDIIMSFTSDKSSRDTPSVKVELVDTSDEIVLQTVKSPQKYQSLGDAGVLIELMETSSGNNVQPPTSVYNVGDTIYVKTTSYSQGGFKTPMFLFLFAKGKLLQTYQVSSGDVTPIAITSQMNLAPSASLLLFSVTSQNELIADEVQVLVSGLMKNQMSMKFNTERQKIGHDVTLTVNTDPNSFIFLVGIDKGSELLEAPNDITQSQVKEGLKEFDIREEDNNNNGGDWGGIMNKKRRKRWAIEDDKTFYGGKGANEILKTVGVVLMTDALVAEVSGVIPWLEDAEVARPNMAPDGANFNQKTSGTIDNVQNDDSVRKNFPESWIWLNEMTGSDGSFSKTIQLPDTITAWVTRGFALSPTNGLGIASNIQVEGFKQFFILVSLPATAVRGEKLEVKLVVFNYFDDSKSVRVMMSSSPDYEIYNDYMNTTQPVAVGTDWTGNLQVPARLSKGRSVYIKPSALGNIRIRVEASTGSQLTDVQDTVEKQLYVDPEGRTIYGGVQELLDATSTMQTLLFVPDFPSTYVPGSRRVTVSATGDIMGQSLQNLDSMIRAPFGCGEQNMISLVPNIYALSYMTATKNLNPDIQNKALANIKKGYERELNYKHTNGGFSAFGQSDPSFSTWLTAFVMKSFAQASKFVFIDTNVLDQAKEAIMSQSNRDGSFNEPGNVIHKDMMTGTSSGAMLTAYIYIAIQETQKAGNAIPGSFDSSLTLKYLEDFYQDSSKVKTQFQLAVLSYCFALGGSQQLDSVLMEINDIATVTDSGDMKCWCDLRKQAAVDGGVSRYMTYDIKPSAIETASYVVLTYLARGDLSSARPIVKWLVSQINGKGGFLSTQDTVMGLQALSTYAERLSSGPKDATIIFKSPGNSDVQFSINSGNAVLLQSKNLEKLDQIGSGVTVEVQGAGNVVVGVNWEYNIEEVDDFKDLHIKITPYQLGTGGIRIEACIWYDGLGDYGMGMMYVDIPTGYQVTNMYDLEQKREIQRIELDGKTLVFYFTQLSRTEMCFDVNTMMEYIVMDAKPSAARATFYYAPEKKTSATYTVAAPLVGPVSRSTSCYNAPVALMAFLVTFLIIDRYVEL